MARAWGYPSGQLGYTDATLIPRVREPAAKIYRATKQ